MVSGQDLMPLSVVFALCIAKMGIFPSKELILVQIKEVIHGNVLGSCFMIITEWEGSEGQLLDD